MKYKFIDLFAGIGGFHLALQSHDMECVFASEIDKLARKTYLHNHKISPDIFNDDIRSIPPEDIPDHDILCAGFPCQPFSQAGYKKGFSDGENSERGNLFFCILDILEAKKPKAFILENVKHLLKHDNGRTFNIIYEHLVNANYYVEFKILQASDFGVPQLRPRIFIVGFHNDQLDTSKPFLFPKPTPLQRTMSDIWGAECSRDIGFTLRVGGRGSPIDDRRNWDAYLVNGKVVRLGPNQGKKMMGLPDDFEFPVTPVQSMKQLGNSVCVDVVKHVSAEVKKYLDNNLKIEESDDMAFNKGEWSEIYAFLKLILDEVMNFGNVDGSQSDDYVTILSLSHNNSDITYEKIGNSTLKIVGVNGNVIRELPISDLIDQTKLLTLFNQLKLSSGSSFNMPGLTDVMSQIDVQKFKGKSNSKADFSVGFTHQNLGFTKEPVGVKSYIGNNPTLLNASSATNFIYEIDGFNGNADEINKIDSSSKIRDRINAIIANGGVLKFVKCETAVHESNLRKVDSSMPEMIAEILLKFYRGQGSKLNQLITNETQIVRFKDYLKAILLGMFSATPWDGNYSSNGTIVVNNNGSLILYHVIKDSILKDYLFNTVKLDTPSSSRHRFGSIYKEGGKLFIKLNLQIRS